MIVFRVRPEWEERPHPNPPQGEGVPPNRLKHSRNGLPPLGEGSGRGPFKAAVFLPAPAGLFFPPTAAFFTVVIAGVMQRMTVGMAPMPRRKTCFPTGIGDSAAKAKPPAVATAFCVYFIPCGDEQINSHSRRRYPQQDSGQKCIGGYYYTHSDNALHQFPVHYPARGDALGWLVSAVTRTRAISHVLTYQMLRGHVSTVTSHQ